MASELIQEYGKKLLPFLVQAAQKRVTPTYGELAEEINVHHRVIRLVLGFIRDEIVLPRGLPMLTAIVINGNTNLPGDNWLPQGTSTLSDAEYEQEFTKFRDLVFAYQGWDLLLKDMNLEPVKSKNKDLDDRGRVYAEYLKRTGGTGEGEGHRQLKEFIATHPGAIGIQTSKLPIVEYAFIAGDEADIIFELPENEWAVIEVKNGDIGELVKGIYQAVKYRALLQAEKGHGTPIQVDAVLAAYQIPSEISMFAAKFGVRCKIVHREKIIAEGNDAS